MVTQSTHCGYSAYTLWGGPWFSGSVRNLQARDRRFESPAPLNLLSGRTPSQGLYPTRALCQPRSEWVPGTRDRDGFCAPEMAVRLYMLPASSNSKTQRPSCRKVAPRREGGGLRLAYEWRGPYTAYTPWSWQKIVSVAIRPRRSSVRGPVTRGETRVSCALREIPHYELPPKFIFFYPLHCG